MDSSYGYGGSGGHGACINREPMIVKSQQVIEITVGTGGSAGGRYDHLNGYSGSSTIVAEISLSGGGPGVWEKNGNGYTGSSPSPNGCDTSSWGAYSSRGCGGAGGGTFYGGPTSYGARMGLNGQNGYVRIEW